MLYNCICSRVVPEVIAEKGGVGIRTKVGHSFIKQVMAETGAIFGGEHSGHYYFRDNYRADSGIIAAMVVLELLSTTGARSPSCSSPSSATPTRARSTPSSTIPPARSSCWPPRSKPPAGQLGSADRLDGLTVDRGDWWYNLRPSNTEPLLRLNVEAPDDAACARHVAEVEADIDRLLAS